MRRVALVAVMTTLLLAGCASDGSGGTDTAAQAAAGQAGNADFQAFTECLSQNGVDVSALPQGRSMGQRPSGAPTDLPSDFPTDRPSGAPSDFPSSGPPRGGPGLGGQVPDGVDEQTWQAAQEACADLRPSGGPGMDRGNGRNGTVDYTVFWSCMADHDVQRPSSGRPSDLDTSDSAVKAALKVCDALLPSATPTATAATG